MISARAVLPSVRTFWRLQLYLGVYFHLDLCTENLHRPTAVAVPKRQGRSKYSTFTTARYKFSSVFRPTASTFCVCLTDYKAVNRRSAGPVLELWSF